MESWKVIQGKAARDQEENEKRGQTRAAQTQVQAQSMAGQPAAALPGGYCASPGSGLLRGHTPGGAGSRAAAQTEETRDVLKPLSALTPAGWSSRLPLGAGPRGIPGPGLSSRADPWLLLSPEPGHA